MEAFLKSSCASLCQAVHTKFVHMTLWQKKEVKKVAKKNKKTSLVKPHLCVCEHGEIL